MHHNIKCQFHCYSIGFPQISKFERRSVINNALLLNALHVYLIKENSSSPNIYNNNNKKLTLAFYPET